MSVHSLSLWQVCWKRQARCRSQCGESSSFARYSPGVLPCFKEASESQEPSHCSFRSVRSSPCVVLCAGRGRVYIPGTALPREAGGQVVKRPLPAAAGAPLLVARRKLTRIGSDRQVALFNAPVNLLSPRRHCEPKLSLITLFSSRLGRSEVIPERQERTVQKVRLII